MNRLNWKTVIEVGKSIGCISYSEHKGDMIGGDFLRVRVEIDDSKPLCHGSKVLPNGDSEGWVSFKYEKMPNFCYWCGMVTHDDKECSIWIARKGSLAVVQWTSRSTELGLELHCPPQVGKLSWQLKVLGMCLRKKY